MAGNKAGLKESWACNLSFADAGGGVNTPSDLPGGDVFIACDFGGDPLPLGEIDPNDLLKVTPVIPDPFSDKLGLRGGIRFHGGRKIDLGAQSRKRCKSGVGFYSKSFK